MRSVDPGFAIYDAVLSDSECNALVDALSPEALSRSRAGARHLLAKPIVASLAVDPRLIRIARERLGSNAVPFRGTLFEKSGRANWLVPWHQDTALPLTSTFESPEWGPWSEKAGIVYAHAPQWALSRIVALRVHLDASTLENGPLRVIPGSHLAGVLTDSGVTGYIEGQEPFECLVSCGGIFAMHPLLIHSSCKARSAEPRRVLHIEYAESLEIAPGIRLSVA